MSIRNTIKSLDFFTTLSDEELNSLAQISTVNSYKQNYILSYEKGETDKLIFLVDGLAKSYKIDKHENEIFLFHIYKNSMLSEISNINDDKLHFFSNISFLDDSKILCIDYEAFKNTFLKNNILNMEFTSEILVKSQQMKSLINREFIFDAVTKVAMMIDSDLDIFNKLKRYDISLMLHIQPSTLSRVLNRLKKNNIIDIVQGKISVLDKQNLEMIYKESSYE
ncbi:MAG: Crp/Fnr family transcriptional regulator [Campylobacterota bacterium]|nr:Crp/Fnr family transcriptional regulator [Campylobacterota bacterium]